MIGSLRRMKNDGIESLTKNTKLCVWYKSQSIEENNLYYSSCRIYCNGQNKECKMYVNWETINEKAKE